MIKLNEFMTQGGLFTHIEQINPLPFLGDGQNEVMDRLLILNYGDRLIFTKLITVSLPEIAKMVTMLNADNWDNLILLDDVNKNASNVRKITETTNSTETRNNSRDDKNLISAYNDESLIVNDGSSIVGKDDSSGLVTRTLTDETVNLKNAYNNLSLVAKNNIMNVVLKDVADFITLSIY